MGGTREGVSPLWRPWETDQKAKERVVVGSEMRNSGAGMDLKSNSQECPLFSAAALLTPSLSTPLPAFSPYSPSQPQRRVLLRAKKRKRSQVELTRRRQRLISFQLDHTPPPTPHKPEPDQPTLESGSWGCSSPGWVPAPLPGHSLPPAWVSSNMAPPSPAFCDGCQRWGNLLSVTVSQTRAH